MVDTNLLNGLTNKITEKSANKGYVFIFFDSRYARMYHTINASDISMSDYYMEIESGHFSFSIDFSNEFDIEMHKELNNVYVLKNENFELWID